MEKKFSRYWKASKQARKKRKYSAQAPLNIKKNFVRANLSRELRKKYGRRNVGLRKGDKVKIMNGGFRKKEGKVTKVFLKISKITMEGIQRKKMDGSKADIKINPSNVQIVELNLEDKKRERTIKPNKEENKLENKEEKK